MEPKRDHMLNDVVSQSSSNFEVTVLITFFGESANLNNLLDDLLSQTIRPNRIVIVDDCAPEPAGDAVAHRKPSAIPIDLFRLSENRGNGYSQAFGVDRISTPLIILVGADDRLLPTHLESLLRQYRTSPGVICPGVIDVWTNGRQTVGRKRASMARLAARTDPFEVLLRGNWAIGASLYPRDALIKHGNFSHIRRSSDYEMMLHLAAGGVPITHCQQFTYLYSRRAKDEPAPIGAGDVLSTRQRVLNTFAERSDRPQARRSRRRARFERRVGALIPKRVQAMITLLSMNPYWWLANLYAMFLTTRDLLVSWRGVRSHEWLKDARNQW